MLADQNLRLRQRNSIIRTNTVRQYVPHAEHWGALNLRSRRPADDEQPHFAAMSRG